ncbi:MAG: zf-HC2 domain-containing protein [Alphaproteobacteria bacterium]|nr:zf-HC2 domain-containing protein [Alphaproteobacteria bacterium]
MASLRSLRWRIQHWLEHTVPGLMTCEEFEQTLVDYLDGAMGPVARRTVDLHVRTCPACRRYMRAYNKARHLAVDALTFSEQKALETIPEDLVQAILAGRNAGVAG